MGEFPKLGVLGGGQLARMTAEAAYPLGVEVHVLEKFAGSPAGAIAHSEMVGRPDDHELLRRFAAACDVVTLESEFINEADLAVVEETGTLLFPSSRSVGKIQDKLLQKDTLRDAGIPVAPYRGVATHEEAAAFGEEQGYPFVLKSRRGGYDGYGNATIRSREDIAVGWEKITQGELRNELYAEAFVPFTKELALMVVRSRAGEMVLYPVVETIQQNHICHLVIAPAEVDPVAAESAAEMGAAAVEAIEGVGIFGVELFLREDGEVLVNELAPRPHNSGHYTIEGCRTSQFENHVRAVMGWPLGSPELLAPAVVMANVLGERHASGVIANYDEVLSDPAMHLHIYGKAECRPGRKMGHVTVLGQSRSDALQQAREGAETISFR